MIDDASLDSWLKSLPKASLDRQTELEDRLQSFTNIGTDASTHLLKAYKLAAAYVSGVLRKDGVPYINHPLRLAMTLEKYFSSVWPKQWIEELQVIALFHDALEEGPGVNQETYQNLVHHLGEIGHAQDQASWLAATAVILTEPEFRGELLSLLPKNRRYLLRKGAMAYQATEWVREHWMSRDPKRAVLVLAAALTDKLINLFDLTYLLRDPSRSQKDVNAKIRTTFIYHAFCLMHYEATAQQLLESTLDLDPISKGSPHEGERLQTPQVEPLLIFAKSCKSLLLNRILTFGWTPKDFFGPLNPLVQYWSQDYQPIIKYIENELIFINIV